MTTVRKSLGIIVLLVLSPSVWAAEDVRTEEKRLEAAPVATSQPAEPEPYSILTTNRLTGDWGGVRTALEEKGIEFGLFLTSVYQHNTHGGIQTHHGHEITGSSDYTLSLDLEKMGVLKGGTFFVWAQSSWGDDVVGGERVGSLFGTNGDATGDDSILVRELWYEQKFLENKIRVRAGWMEAWTDFDTNAYANDETLQFLNPALINTWTIAAPADGIGVGLGAQVMIQPTDWFYAGAAAIDADADQRRTGVHSAFHDQAHFFGIWEFGFTPTWETRLGKLPGGYRFGLWYNPNDRPKFFNDLDGRRRTIPMKNGDTGFYFNMDQLLFKEKPEDDEDAQGLGMFFRYGYAHDDVNEIEHVWSIGCQYQGLLPTRDKDVLGFGFAQGILSRRLVGLEGGDRESVYELYYNIEVLPWLQVSPDFQLITNPGGSKHTRDAFVAGVRVQANF